MERGGDTWSIHYVEIYNRRVTHIAILFHPSSLTIGAEQNPWNFLKVSTLRMHTRWEAFSFPSSHQHNTVESSFQYMGSLMLRSMLGDDEGRILDGCIAENHSWTLWVVDGNQESQNDRGGMVSSTCASRICVQND